MTEIQEPISVVRGIFLVSHRRASARARSSVFSFGCDGPAEADDEAAGARLEIGQCVVAKEAACGRQGEVGLNGEVRKDGEQDINELRGDDVGRGIGKVGEK